MSLLAAFAALLFSLPIHAQTYTVLHNFSGGSDSGYPSYGVTIDSAGNLWGTTWNTVFRMSQNGFSTLYTVGSGLAFPDDLLIDPMGTLWGATSEGGDRQCNSDGCGTLFNLRPRASASPTANGYWKETTVYEFHGSGQGEGSTPNPGLIQNSAGNFFGTTGGGGGTCNCGTVFELSRFGQDWTLTTLYAFAGGNDGKNPLSGVVAIGDKLYGTTELGGSSGLGVVYELTPNGSGWSERPIYTFTGGHDGYVAYGGVTADPDGNLYGSTLGGGTGGGGTVFKLTNTAGNWSYQLVYSLTGSGGPTGTLALDSQQNIYGTTEADGAYTWGSAFELMPAGQGWTYRTLHDFCPQCDGGVTPLGKVSLDRDGNLFGTTVEGGTGCAPQGCGVLWKITP
jgi:uncharacterized repeat protein (TIGR03803 family)